MNITKLVFLFVSKISNNKKLCDVPVRVLVLHKTYDKGSKVDQGSCLQALGVFCSLGSRFLGEHGVGCH